ncbi:MAG: methyltransferase domain-containing protein [Phycisphaeraceae bacterium]
MPVVWPNLKRRDRVGELMDDPSLPKAEHARALRGLRRINAVSRTPQTLFKRLRELMGDDRDQPRRILDVACGDGDNTIRLARLAQRDGLPWRVLGCDISERSVVFARRLAERRGVEAHFFRADALGDLEPQGYDAVVNALFLHHLDDAQIVELLGRLRQAKCVVISDLVRSGFAYGVTLAGVRLLSRSGVVHVDGPRSVRAALTRSELSRLASEAGMNDAAIESSWPMRQLLVWSRS